MISTGVQGARAFLFERDTFAFAHELVWEYRFDSATGALTTARANPPPTYYHRCFVMVRSVRQFFCHARFEPGLPSADAATCRRLIRAVVSRNPRRISAEPDRVVVPGYDGLRALSRTWEPLLKAECGAALGILLSAQSLAYGLPGLARAPGTDGSPAGTISQGRGRSDRASLPLSPCYDQPRHPALWGQLRGWGAPVSGLRS